MGQLVFQRLFYHHMVGQLQGHSDFKNRLFMYTDGENFCGIFFFQVIFGTCCNHKLSTLITELVW